MSRSWLATETTGKAVVGLVKGLRRAKSAYPLVVAVLPDIPKDHRKKLISQGCILREIEPVSPPEGQDRFAWAHHAVNYSKLRMWEDLLNMFFKDVYMPIVPHYNFLVAMLWRHPEGIDLENVKLVHYYASGSKPWRYTGKEEHMDREDIKMLVKAWWDIYDDETLDLVRNIDGFVADDEDTEAEVINFRASLSEAGVIYHIPTPTAA